MSDILLGAVDTLSWQQIKPWVLSAKESGFVGDIWLIVYRCDDTLVSTLEAHGVNVYKVDHDASGQPIQHAAKGSPTQAHNLRFYHAWELLTRLYDGKADHEVTDWVIFTDVRDVIFQANPQHHNRYKAFNGHALIAQSEGIMFEQEDWNKQNMITTYGPLHYELAAKQWKAYNVGTMAGHAIVMREVSKLIYAMTEGRAYPSDQSSFNILVHGTLQYYMWKLGHQWGWAAQCGVMLDPTKPWLHDKICEERPVIKDGLVYTSRDKLFCLVHQWDRVPELKVYIEDKYK